MRKKGRRRNLTEGFKIGVLGCSACLEDFRNAAKVARAYT